MRSRGQLRLARADMRFFIFHTFTPRPTYYLRQVNQVNWRRYWFVCLCARSEPVNQTVEALNATSSKIDKATGCKFDTRFHVIP